jgi:hypothetical protein
MLSDTKLFKWLGLLILLPLMLAIFGGDRFRYPCQDPDNWDKKECTKPTCEVTRTCPEHILKGGNNATQNNPIPQTPVQGATNCAK